jgi:hypothetical protein
MDARTLLSAVLGVGLGLLLVAYPDAVVRAQTAGRLPDDRHGEYGEEAVSTQWRRLVQAVGLVVVAAGLYFAGRVAGVV